MKLSILVPVFNEEKTIMQVLKQLLELRLPCAKEIIVIDDGSTDKTKEKILRYLDTKKIRKKIKYISLRTNQGKGRAIQNGVRLATGEYILIQDADLEYNPAEIPNLIAPIINRRDKSISQSDTVAVYGSRFKNKQAIIPPLYLVGNKFLTFVTNLIYYTKLTDMETGYKLLPASFVKKISLSSSHFDIEPEITAKLIKSKIRIIEVPITYKGRTHLAGKKLTAIDAFEALKTLIYFRFYK